jgi:hypothetical protein
VTVLASIRPDSVNVALLVHVVGAMVLVGGLVTAAAASLVGWRDQGVALQRLSYKTLLMLALPGWIVMRVGAEWVFSKEHLDDLPSDPTWIGIGSGTSDAGGLLLLIALIVGGFGLRRARNGGSTGLLKAGGIIATVLVAAYVVAVWAMGAKPS